LEFRKLGNLEVSSIGLGTLRTFDVTSDADITVRQEIVDNCLANDINFIDSAAYYGNAEKVVGITTDGKRDRFREGKEAGEAQIARSFELFNTGYIDLFQVHNMIDWQTHLPTLQSLKEQGKIGMVGVSAMVHEAYPVIVDLMKSRRIDAVQIPYNVLETGCESELLPVAEELGIGVLIMEPLKKGRFVNDLKSQPDLTPLAEFGIKTWAQALLAWVLADSRVSVTIPATSRPERIKENALPGSLGQLPQELRDYVREETIRCL